MREMALKQKLKKRELTIDSWITIGNTVVAEIMASAGYDWLTVDMEHSAILSRELWMPVRTGLSCRW